MGYLSMDVRKRRLIPVDRNDSLILLTETECLLCDIRCIGTFAFIRLNLDSEG